MNPEHTKNPVNKVRYKRSRRRLVVWGVGAIIVGYITLYSPLPFVKSLWASGPRKNLSVLKLRNRMADGLLISDSLIGKGKVEIIERLGPPTGTAKFDSWDLVYHLGRERGFFALDSEWLAIRFNSSGLASKASIVRD